MIKVTLEFKDKEVITVNLEPHVYEMWQGEMKRHLEKVAKIIELKNENN
jgi:hypothetical protein